MFITLLITITIYVFMVLFTKNRTPIAFLGSGVLLILGAITSSFDAGLAFTKFPSEIIILILVLSLFTDIFDRLGLINFIGYKYISFSKENKIRILITIPLIMYAASLFMNNLIVVLVFTYMVLYLCLEYDLPIVPVLVSVVIGSNIGGAPLPWADTPAVILTIYSDFNFLDFLNKLFAPCLIYVILLSLYTYIWYKRNSPPKREIPFKEKPDVKWDELKLPLIIFIIYIIGISVGPFFDISIAYISLFFGGILLLIDKANPMDTLNNIPIMDSISFIIALFLIGGVLEYSGILTMASEFIINLTNNNPYLMVLSILSLSFVISTFLSAGPAAATLLPICTLLDATVPFKLVYAALALGILCGSSMLPWSATGGPILLSQTNKFLKKPELDDKERSRISKIYKLTAYVKFSIPFSLIMFILSAIYLLLYIAFII